MMILIILKEALCLDGVGQYIAGKIDQILAQDPNLNDNLNNNNVDLNNNNINNNNNNNHVNNNNYVNNNNNHNNSNFSISEWLEQLGYPQYHISK